MSDIVYISEQSPRQQHAGGKGGSRILNAF